VRFYVVFEKDHRTATIPVISTHSITKEITGDGTNFEALGCGSNIPNYVYVEATEAIPRTTTVYST
jgi:hypothetical protein